jgi:hypothetical protein
MPHWKEAFQGVGLKVLVYEGGEFDTSAYTVVLCTPQRVSSEIKLDGFLQ